MPGLAVGRVCVAAVLTRSLTGSGPLTLRGVVFVLVRRLGVYRHELQQMLVSHQVQVYCRGVTRRYDQARWPPIG